MIQSVLRLPTRGSRLTRVSTFVCRTFAASLGLLRLTSLLVAMYTMPMQLGRTPRQHRPSAPLSGGHLLDAHQLALYGAQRREGQRSLYYRTRRRGHCVLAAAVLEVHLGVLSLFHFALRP